MAGSLRLWSKAAITAIAVGWAGIMLFVGWGPGQLEPLPAVLLAVAGSAGVLGASTRRDGVAFACLAVLVVSFATYVAVASAIPNTRGDEWFWGALGFWVPDSEVWVSSMLPMWLLQALGPERFGRINPAAGIPVLLGAGVLATIVGRRVGTGLPKHQLMALGMGVVLVTGAPMLFVGNYHEMYPLASVVAVGAIALLMATPASPDSRWLVLLGATCAAAVCWHGGYIWLFPAACFAVWDRTQRLGPPAFTAGAGAVTIVLVVATLNATGSDLRWGNAAGGMGGPLVTELFGPHRWEELAIVCTVVVGGSLPLVILGALTRDASQCRRDALALSVGPVVFWLLWGFDYGFPLDLDVATSGVWGVLPLAMIGATRLARPARLIPAGLVIVAATSALLSSYVMPVVDYPEQPGIVVPQVNP